uniref:UPAR/Ly6 domain-containing protein n=1 Tax=Sciurus vulgaris TaxID=55149 RepID=A0A8D2DD95_SCIVU
MENLMKLCLFLLAIEIAVALQCIQCRGYHNKICEHKVETCTAGEGETCMIRRIWTWPYNMDNPETAETNCLKDCKNSEDDGSHYSELIFCCTWHDFCNDIRIPIEF